ncbi:hypothetical protein B0T22DRAFT_476173 [Podospora appendiculata]|uniref:Uncharacterized protein n=1 Tax=Podospora appendiculata TaxID=314037 RepID=A0AAE0XH55_9PEZI|nr:hypothetical protein B0T22DRAFT_476173 [Podospora appendiculata]
MFAATKRNFEAPSFSSQETQHRAQPKAQMSWWWWWELGAALVSITSISLIVTMLFKSDGLALSAWVLPIQPNSLIAVLTTIGKTAMMVPVASCLGHLKWHHFTPRPQPLDRLQRFDEASRGPWGSLVLLLTTRALLGCGFALITLAALGIETTAQQILEFPTRDYAIPGAKAELGVATLYNSTAFRGSGIPSLNHNLTTHLLSYESAMVNSALGVKTQPYFKCPDAATNCTFPVYATLGVCGEFQNRTSELTAVCKTHNSSVKTCTYDWPGFSTVGSETAPKMSFNHSNGGFLDLFKSHYQSDGAHSRYELRMNYLRVRKEDVINGSYPNPELLEARWAWCAQTYNSTKIVSNTLIRGPVSTELLTEGSINKALGNMYVEYKANSTGDTYNVAYNTVGWIWENIKTGLTSAVSRQGGPEANGILHLDRDQATNTENHLGLFLLGADMAEVTANIATTMSNFIRSPTTGENSNATVLGGQAFGRETYIHVRWGWLILPLSETLITAGLLVTTILYTGGLGKPLLKSSTLGLLFYPLERQLAREVDDCLEDGETEERLLEVAKGLVVQFRDDEEGKLRFMRGTQSSVST